MDVKPLYQIFAKCFYYPDRELVTFLLTEDPLPFIASGELTADEDVLHVKKWLSGFARAHDLLESLRVEYTKLFVTSYPTVPAPPYKSYYFERELYGHAAGELSDIYRENGFRVSTGMKEPPDHLAVLAEFLHRVSGTVPPVLERTFIEQHLLSWLDAFLARVGQHATVPFYPFVTSAFFHFLQQRVTHLNALITGVKS